MSGMDLRARVSEANRCPQAWQHSYRFRELRHLCVRARIMINELMQWNPSHPELCFDASLREHGASLLEVPEIELHHASELARRRRVCALPVNSMAVFAGAGLVSRRLQGNPFKAPLQLLEPRPDAPRRS